MRNVEAAGCSLPACLCIPSGVSEFGALGEGAWGVWSLGFWARDWLELGGLRNFGIKSGQNPVGRREGCQTYVSLLGTLHIHVGPYVIM